MTPLRDKAIADLRVSAIDAIVERYGLRRRGPVRVTPAEAVDVLLAAGMLTDPEECARTYSLISELIATGKDDDAERAYRLAVKAWRRARDVADGKPLPPRDDEARIERALVAVWRVRLLPASALNGQSRSEAIARAALAAADQEDD